ncbi:binding-protein-dependent transport systems inner membrane component [Kribbella flavida DSM 17836]|uniref:Binding-protein-dependent transport systems inner membrane component n=1 Tax=Kribbella flavida (strain DSM 17836 / JCM 10339 / NBRC 14399) TaxID=479435 RepID=D2Q0N2_KRIFD|nr:carbohydrate ABC transporter permease [Kribbella flavida]ADB33832.1 binding-protein-dependent transport systems inner membrane component [Kribbella flavida DSM 17836]
MSAESNHSGRIREVVSHLVLMFGVALSIFPFYWMLVMASNTTPDIFTYPPKLVVGSHLLENMRNVLDNIDFFGAMLITLLASLGVTVLVLFFDSLAAFAFAKYEFPGSKWLFGLLLATFMIPSQLALVPQFVTLAEFGWIGSLKALIIPGAANAFGIFWMRQYARGAIPDELIAAAKVDGAGFFRQYLTVGLPVLRPGLAFLGIFTFINVWNDYLWPLIVMTDPNKLTLQVALQQLNGVYGTDYSMVMAGALMSVVPLIGVFVIGGRHFIADIAAGAVKS